MNHPALSGPALYAITDEAISGRGHLEQVRDFLAAGIRIVQVREKDPARAGFRETLAECQRLCRAAGALFVLNDHPHLAAELRLDGLHLGQGDMSPAEARGIVGPECVIGFSTHTREQFRAALLQPADYLALGPVFGTSTKRNPDPPPGMDVVAEAAESMASAGRPFVLIGGITGANAPGLRAIAPQAILAVIGALLRGSVEENAQAFRAILAAPASMRALGEAGLLRTMGARFAAHTAGLPMGTGDDAAATPDGLAWTIDTMVEGTHFRWWPELLAHPEWLGAKLADSTLSDLAAKGAAPRWALLSLGAPPHAPAARVERVLDGLLQRLEALGARLIGGDTVSAPQWTLSLTAAGDLPPGRRIPTRRAAIGSQLYVSGWPGESAGGLALLEGRLSADPADREHLVRRHLLPTARFELGRALSDAFDDLATIDVSDGIAKDAGEVAAHSRAKVVIEESALPISAALRRAAGDRAAWFALHGGEDYELLFATAADPARVLALGTAECPITRIGAVLAGQGVELQSAHGPQALVPEGFQHFAPR
jgi:thiamine-monophosphate kinase